MFFTDDIAVITETHSTNQVTNHKIKMTNHVPQIEALKSMHFSLQKKQQQLLEQIEGEQHMLFGTLGYFALDQKHKFIHLDLVVKKKP